MPFGPGHSGSEETDNIGTVVYDIVTTAAAKLIVKGVDCYIKGFFYAAGATSFALIALKLTGRI